MGEEVLEYSGGEGPMSAGARLRQRRHDAHRFLFECLGDGLIESGEQAGQSLAVAAHEHRQGVVLVGGDELDASVQPTLFCAPVELTMGL
jgi:hypothetical protein